MGPGQLWVSRPGLRSVERRGADIPQVRPAQDCTREVLKLCESDHARALFAGKAGTAAVFCIAAALAVAIGGLIMGAILFPIGRVTTLSGTTLSLTEGMLRTFIAALIVGSSMFGLAAVGLFISTLTDVPVGAMAATVAFAILSAVLDSVPQLHAVHPWLFTHYWFAFSDLIRSPVRWHDISKGMMLQLGYVAVFGSAAWARFTTKDVLA